MTSCYVRGHSHIQVTFTSLSAGFQRDAQGHKELLYSSSAAWSSNIWDLGQTYNTAIWIMSCVFCDVSAKKGFSIVYEDDKFVAFEDISPAAVVHVQVVPKKHIGNCQIL